jgi:hypothetical protein
MAGEGFSFFICFFAAALRLVGQIFNFFAKKSQNFGPFIFLFFLTISIVIENFFHIDGS